MVQKTDVHQLAGFAYGLGLLDVGGTWDRIARRVIMNKQDVGGIVQQCSPENTADIDDGGSEGTHREHLLSYHTVCAVQEHDPQLFVVERDHVVVQEFCFLRTV